MTLRLVLVLTLVVLVVAACSSSRTGGASTRSSAAQSQLALGVHVLPAGQRVVFPDLRGAGLGGRPLDGRSLLPRPGHLLLVSAWASWCSPCRDEVPLLGAVARGRLVRGFSVLGLDERDRTDAARAFLASRHASYPSLSDPDGALLHRLPMVPQVAIPSTVVVGADGRVHAVCIGALTRAALVSLRKVA